MQYKLSPLIAWLTKVFNTLTIAIANYNYTPPPSSVMYYVTSLVNKKLLINLSILELTGQHPLWQLVQQGDHPYPQVQQEGHPGER